MTEGDGPPAAGHATVPARAPETSVDEPPSAVFPLNRSDFDRVVLMSDRPVLVHFHASWSTASKNIQPTIDELAREFDGRVTVVRVDSYRDADLFAEYQVKNYPSLLLFVNGRLQAPIDIGPKDELAKLLTSHVTPQPERTAALTADPVPPAPPAPPMPTADNRPAPGER